MSENSSPNSNSKRKNPLTTIAISQEYAKRLQVLADKWGIDRKAFVEKAVEYFEKTGLDIRYYEIDINPIEKVAADLREQAGKVIFDSDKKTETLSLLRDFINQFNQQQPALEDLRSRNTAAEVEKKALSGQIEQLKADVDEAKAAGEEVAKSKDAIIERIRAIIDDYTTKTAEISGWGKGKKRRQLLEELQGEIETALSKEKKPTNE